MKPFLIYILQSGLCLAVFYSVYELFLKRETYFQLNRIFLVSGLLLSFFIPAFPITSPFKAPAVPIKFDYASILSASVRGFGSADFLYGLYGIGVLVFLLRFGLQLAKLRRIVRTHGIRRLCGAKIVAVDRLFSPFSFLDIIFINQGPSIDANLRRILAHEQVHIRQQHTLDVLLMEIVLSLQWFNPFVWPYKKALQETHEYLADSGVIAQGFNSVKYQLLMFEQHVGASLFELGNNFKRSQIKRRIMMLSKIKSPKAAKLKLLLALPLAIALVLIFAEPRVAAETSAFQQKSSPADPTQTKITQVKEEFDNLIAAEQDLRRKMETAQDETTKKELAKNIETVIQKRQQLAISHNANFIPSPHELEVKFKELKEKEGVLLAELEKTTDESKKTALMKTLENIKQYRALLKDAARYYESPQPATKEMKKQMVELI
jgi:hypothetical protein